MQKFAPRFTEITIVHASPGVRNSDGIRVISSILSDDYLLDESAERNNRAVVVTSFDTLASQYGPAAMEKRLSASNITVTPHPIGTQPPLHPEFEAYIPKVRGMILDEPQVGTRNDNTHRATIEYFNAPRVFLYSGSPAPRGLDDYASYIGLISLPDVEADARSHFGKGVKPRVIRVGAEEFKTGTDPYLLPDEHFAKKYCYTRTYFKRFISHAPPPPRAKSGKKAESKAKVDMRHKYDLATKVKATLSKWVLRRDYNSACPIGSKRVIADNLPPLTHYGVETMFSVQGHREYEAGYDEWKGRFMTMGDETLNQPPKPNPRAQRAIALLTLFPPFRHLHLPNPYYKKPKRGDYRQPDPKADSVKEDEKDFFSWFFDDSKLSKDMPTPGSNLLTWRYLLSRICQTDTYAALGTPLFVYSNGKPIEGSDFETFKKVDNTTVLKNVIRFAPKISVALALYQRHSIVQEEKILFWFRWPRVQHLFLECLWVVNGLRPDCALIKSIDSDTAASTRTTIRNNFTTPGSDPAILAASMDVAGTGTNFQGSCHVAIMMEICDTIDKELQVMGRTHRLGATKHNFVYSITVAQTIDQRSIT